MGSVYVTSLTHIAQVLRPKSCLVVGLFRLEGRGKMCRARRRKGKPPAALAAGRDVAKNRQEEAMRWD
jgi:hypothetical protein